MTPRAGINALSLQGNQIRARVAAAPTDGQANEAFIQLLAKTLHIGPSRITILRGQTSRNKLVAIDGLSLAEVIAALG